MGSWVLGLGFHEAAIKVTAGLHSHLELGLGENLLPRFPILLADLASLLL